MFCFQDGSTEPAAQPAFELVKSLVGEWHASLAGFGPLTNSIRLVSNGAAVEETIGTPQDNETSLYSRDGARVLLTHFCSMTSGGHEVRLASMDSSAVGRSELRFRFVDASNLASVREPHMRDMVMSVIDKAHFRERWTKTEAGKDIVFDLDFVRVR